MSRWPGRRRGKFLRPTITRARHGATATTALLGSVSLAIAAGPAAHARETAPGGAHASLRLTVTVPPPTAADRALQVTPPDVTVAPGDTVSAIAERYGLATADVLAWNGLDWSSIIRPGQRIALSPGAVPGAAPAAAAPVAAPDSPASASRIVAAGDTLWDIAREAGTSVDALLSANGLDRGAIIYPGESLLLPGAAPAGVDAAAAEPVAAPAAEPVTLDAEQAENARIIISVGRSRGVSDRGIAIALATSMVESWLRNLDWGDRDSLGLFQQRPSTGWGTDAEVRDPYRAAAAFFGGPGDPNGAATRGLLDVDGWESMDFGAAAQAVQISAHPERYGPWEQQAYAWLGELG